MNRTGKPSRRVELQFLFGTVGLVACQVVIVVLSREKMAKEKEKEKIQKVIR